VLKAEHSVMNSYPVLRIEVDCVATKREFYRLEKDWNPLLLESVRPVPFLTWEWVSTWWEFFGHKSTLFVLVARDQTGRVLGIAPLHIVMRRAFGLMPVRTVEFLTYRGSKVCTDHLDLIIQREHQEAIASALIRELLARSDQWDALDLADMAEESRVPDLLKRLSEEDGLVTECRSAERCPYATLPRRWEVLFASLKSKHRNNLKRRREALGRTLRVQFDAYCPTDHVTGQLDTLGKLHTSARNRKGESGNFHVEQYRTFHNAVAQRMAQSGHLYFARLDCNAVTVAALYGYSFGGRLFGYQTGFDANWADKGVGAILQAMVFEDAIERLGASEYDFLRGTEEYKYQWTTKERLTRTVLGWNTSFRARMATTEFLAKRCTASLRTRFGTSLR
jgi:CelD/BcsL family acetyltransferase involved in cellulose biosynthesis